jgi:hypothetical protein
LFGNHLLPFHSNPHTSLLPLLLIPSRITISRSCVVLLWSDGRRQVLGSTASRLAIAALTPASALASPVYPFLGGRDELSIPNRFWRWGICQVWQRVQELWFLMYYSSTTYYSLWKLAATEIDSKSPILQV